MWNKTFKIIVAMAFGQWAKAAKVRPFPYLLNAFIIIHCADDKQISSLQLIHPNTVSFSAFSLTIVDDNFFFPCENT